MYTFFLNSHDNIYFQIPCGVKLTQKCKANSKVTSIILIKKEKKWWSYHYRMITVRSKF